MYLSGTKSYEVLLRDSLAADWLESYENPKTREDYARAFMVILRGTEFTPKELLELDTAEARKRVMAIARGYLKTGHSAAALQIQTAAVAFFQHHRKPLDFTKKERIKKVRKKVGIEIIPNKQQVYAMANYIKKADSPDRIRTRAVILCLFQSGVRVGCLSRWTIGMVHEQLYPDIKIPVRLMITNQLDTKLSAYGLSYYYTFLQQEGANALRQYLDWRMQTEGTLNDPDYIFKPSRKFAKNPRTEPDRVLGLVKTAAKNTGLDPKRVWTHALRKSFRKVLNATPELDEDTKYALMGHRLPGSRENYFDSHDIDEIAEKYMKASFDSAEDESVAKMNRRFLLMAGYSDLEIEEFGDLAALSEQQMQDLIQKKSQSKAPNVVRQKVVPMRKVKKWIEQGWEYVTQLPNGDAIVRRL
jgi:integrase